MIRIGALPRFHGAMTVDLRVPWRPDWKLYGSSSATCELSHRRLVNALSKTLGCASDAARSTPRTALNVSRVKLADAWARRSPQGHRGAQMPAIHAVVLEAPVEHGVESLGDPVQRSNLQVSHELLTVWGGERDDLDHHGVRLGRIAELLHAHQRLRGRGDTDRNVTEER